MLDEYFSLMDGNFLLIHIKAVGENKVVFQARCPIYSESNGIKAKLIMMERGIPMANLSKYRRSFPFVMHSHHSLKYPQMEN